MATRSTLLGTALADAATGSWIALGGDLPGHAVKDVVDIEALIAATARLGERVEARTREVAVDWCVRFGWAVSGARLTRVAAELRAAGATAEFAARTAAAGGVRWPIASPSPSPSPRPAPQVSGRLDVSDLEGCSRLAWRLRAAFGTASRADVLLATLLSPAPLSLAELARRTRYTKGAVAAAVGALELAGLVEVLRIGREARIALAPDSIVAAWAKGAGTQGYDTVARWQVGIAALETLEATAGLSHADAAAARRACVDGLVGEIVRGDLPRPNTKVRGPVFAVHFEFWAAELAGVISPST